MIHQCTVFMLCAAVVWTGGLRTLLAKDLVFISNINKYVACCMREGEGEMLLLGPSIVEVCLQINWLVA